MAMVTDPQASRLIARGVFSTIDVPGATYTECDDSNGAGQIVGTYDDAGGVTRGYLLDKGTLTTIDVPGSIATYAYGINAGGRIVGRYRDSAGDSHGFWRKPSEMRAVSEAHELAGGRQRDPEVDLVAACAERDVAGAYREGPQGSQVGRLPE